MIGSSGENMNVPSLAIALGCCAFASCDDLPSFVVFSFMVPAILESARLTTSIRKSGPRRGVSLNARSLALEGVVMLAAIAMRLSPIERDFLAASLFALLCRFWGPARENRQFQSEESFIAPCPKE